MYRITIKNIVTDTDFAASFPTEAQCLAWHRTCLAVHGDELANPPTAVVSVFLDKDYLFQKLWSDTNAFGEMQMDMNSRTSINLMLASGTATPQQLSRINDFGDWWKSLWMYYAQQKAKIAAGQVAGFDPSVVGNTPWTIWEISA